MSRLTTRCSRTVFASGLAAVSALHGCTLNDTASPVVATGAVGAVVMQDSMPMYYLVFNRQEAVTPVSAQMVVQLRGASTESAVRTAIGRTAGAVRQVTPLKQLRDHGLVDLSTTPTGIEPLAAMLRADPDIGFAEPVYIHMSTGSRVQPVNRLVVRFKSGVSGVSIDSFITGLQLELERPPRPDSGFFEYLFSYPKGPSARALTIAARAANHPAVLWAAPDFIGNVRPAYVPTDAYYSLQFHLKGDTFYLGVRVDDNVEQAWDLTTGAGVKVAIIDDGIDASHTDYWQALNGGQGYDVINSGGGSICQGDSFAPQGSDTHGTSITGIVAAGHNNGGVAGISPGVVLRSVRIFCGTFAPGPIQRATDSQIADGTRRAERYIALGEYGAGRLFRMK